jgi:hypothetical protein
VFVQAASTWLWKHLFVHLAIEWQDDQACIPIVGVLVSSYAITSPPDNLAMPPFPEEECTCSMWLDAVAHGQNAFTSNAQS